MEGNITYFRNPAFWTRSDALSPRYHSEFVRSLLRHPSAQSMPASDKFLLAETLWELQSWAVTE
jgi:hypothetical protein